MIKIQGNNSYYQIFNETVLQIYYTLYKKSQNMFVEGNNIHYEESRYYYTAQNSVLRSSPCNHLQKQSSREFKGSVREK